MAVHCDWQLLMSPHSLGQILIMHLTCHASLMLTCPPDW